MLLDDVKERSNDCFARVDRFSFVEFHKEGQPPSQYFGIGPTQMYLY